jgi:hypothetical protein
MADLFKEVLPSIFSTKKDVLLTTQDEKEYNAFIVNKALSQNKGDVHCANEMNMHHQLDSKLQYHFLLNILRAYKRSYAKWHKKSMSDDLEVVKEYYGYSTAKAMDVLTILNDEQINEIRKKTYKGD